MIFDNILFKNEKICSPFYFKEEFCSQHFIVGFQYFCFNESTCKTKAKIPALKLKKICITELKNFDRKNQAFKAVNYVT